VVSKTIDEEYSMEVFMVPDGYVVDNLEFAKRYSSKSSRLSVRRLAILTAVCSDSSLGPKKKKGIYASARQHAGC
jgi:hypothetical protein